MLGGTLRISDGPLRAEQRKQEFEIDRRYSWEFEVNGKAVAKGSDDVRYKGSRTEFWLQKGSRTSDGMYLEIEGRVRRDRLDMNVSDSFTHDRKTADLGLISRLSTLVKQRP